MEDQAKYVTTGSQSTAFIQIVEPDLKIVGTPRYRSGETFPYCIEIQLPDGRVHEYRWHRLLEKEQI